MLLFLDISLPVSLFSLYYQLLLWALWVCFAFAFCVPVRCPRARIWVWWVWGEREREASWGLFRNCIAEILQRKPMHMKTNKRTDGRTAIAAGSWAVRTGRSERARRKQKKESSTVQYNTLHLHVHVLCLCCVCVIVFINNSDYYTPKLIPHKTHTQQQQRRIVITI